MKQQEATYIDIMAVGINRWANEKGFWADHGDIPAGLVKSQKIMLIVTELAELVEGLRKPVPSSIPGFTNEEEEAADTMIRLLDYCGQYNLRIGAAVLAKMEVNEGRPFKHGKEF